MLTIPQLCKEGSQKVLTLSCLQYSMKHFAKILDESVDNKHLCMCNFTLFGPINGVKVIMKNGCSRGFCLLGKPQSSGGT
ncbi:uncharacterized [Tachysurus ichikawai]